MSSALPVKGRHAGADVTQSMSDATAQAVKRSKEHFIADMRKLLSEARRYLGDVCWRLDGEDEIIYGHRAILYARANAAFQSRFLNPNGSARLQAIMSGSSLSLQSPSSPVPRAGLTLQPDSGHTSRSVSPGALSVESFGSSRNSIVPPSGARSPIPVSGTESAFFKGLLDFFYTASTPLGEVFTFLFEDTSYVDKEDAMDRLSQDLLFMWRSKLFADMHIQLSEAMGHILEDDEDALSDTPTISEDRLFPAHRAILAARSPYFNSMFLSPFSDSESSLFTLPSPPFTPAALHFVLAYLYTGSFSLNRTFDLTVAMDIWKCATYLNNDILQEEVQCRIVDMCHGFRACCKTCRSRAVRTYAFAIAPEVNAKYLQAQAKSIVLDHFGELWGREVGNLPYTTQKDLLVDKCSRTNASNAADAMRGIMRIRSRLAGERNASWADHIRSMLVPLEDRIKHFLKADFAEMAVSRPFIDLVEGIGFSNDVLEKLLALLVESLSEKNAAGIYEVLVGKLLLREEGIAMDTRARLEDARQDILKYIKARWVGVKGLNSFEPLENWCLKELSDELEQTVDDLLQSPSLTAPLTTRTGLKLSTTKVHKVDSDAFSIVSAPPSLHASVLNRDTVRKSMTPSSSRKSTFTFNSGDAKSLSDNPRTPVRGVPGTKKRIVPKNRVDTQATEVVHAGDRIAGSLSALKVEHSVTSNPEPSGEGSQSARAPPVTSQSARQPPGMTKAARLRQSSTASKLLAQDTEAREKLARPSSSTSLRSHAGQSKLLNDSPRGGTASRAASIASTRTRRLDVDAASLRQKGVRTPTSPKPQGVRSSSVTSTLVKRRPSVSSIKSNRTTASSKYTASKSPKSQQSAIPPLPGSSESSVHLQTASTGVAFADLGRSPPGVKLQIGIDCVVTLGSIKFKATVRYLGGVYFDDETYVGVEVPAATSDVPEGLRWTDGTVDGVQYFALSTRNKIEAPKGRSAVHSDRSKTKVKASPVGATRGLFVKPSQGMSTSEVW